MQKQQIAFAETIMHERESIFMEGKVALININGDKIGETYTRRARQLVKQQRAVWVDDSQKAIRFTSDEVAVADVESEYFMQEVIMKKWEYKCVWILGGGETTTRRLNEYGREGWELVSTDFWGFYYFKKETN